MLDREVAGQNVTLLHPSQSSETYREGALNKPSKLLFLTWHFPPARAIACVRTWNTAKYLARLGWDVTVVTPHPSVWRYVDNPEEVDSNVKQEGIRRILTDHRWRCLVPDRLNCWNQGPGWFFGGVCRTITRRLGLDGATSWVKTAERTCSTLTAKDADVILASGPPFAAFKLAKRLSDRIGRPYVLDYRDPWVGFPHASRPVRPATIREEAKLLAHCAAVTIVSHSWGLAMDHRFGLGSKLHVVTNGYDPEELAEVKPYEFGHFAIVYAGTFYPPKRVISPVMAALKCLKETTNGRAGEWYFHYYGEHGDHVREEATRFGVMERVVLHGIAPRTEALSAVRGAGVAVIITSVFEEASLEDKGIVTGKVFEILGLKCPVLLIAPPTSDIETIVKTVRSVRTFSGSNIEEMTAFLSEMMYGQTPKSKDIESYAWTNVIKKMDAVLRAAITIAPRNEQTS